MKNTNVKLAEIVARLEEVPAGRWNQRLGPTYDLRDNGLIYTVTQAPVEVINPFRFVGKCLSEPELASDLTTSHWIYSLIVEGQHTLLYKFDQDSRKKYPVSIADFHRRLGTVISLASTINLEVLARRDHMRLKRFLGK